MNSGIEKVKDLYEEHKLDEYISRIEEEIIENINKKYETEPFFNSFSNFYEGNKITNRILDKIFHVEDEESVEGMIDVLARSFTSQYGMYSIYETRIKEILRGVYQSIFKGLTDSGLLSGDDITQLLMAKYGRKQLYSIFEVKEITKRMAGQIESIKGLLENDRESHLPHSFSVLSESAENTLDNSEYAEMIKHIEDEIQKKYNFQEAIDEYKNVLTDLFEMRCSEESLFADIYINIALCYANLEKYTDAEKNIHLAAKHVKGDSNSKLHYVKGYIHWQESRQENGEIAREELLKALSINPKYISAQLLLCMVEAVLQRDLTSIIQNLEKLENEAPKDRLGEVLQAYGFVYRLYEQFEKAEEYVLRADKEEKDVSNTANLGVIYYAWATQNNAHDRRQLRINVDYPKLFKALHYLKEVIQDTSKEATLYKPQLMGFYISACMLCDVYEFIDEIGTVDISSLDYEAARALIYHRIRKGDEAAAELLQKEDKEFHDVVSIVEEQEQNSLDIIISKIKQVSEVELYRYYNLGLRVALNIRDLEKFKLLRSEVKNKNIECPYLDLYDAEYYSILGQDEKAKAYFDRNIYEICDEYILLPAIKFYKDRGFVPELLVLYEETLKKLVARKITCHNVKALVGEIFGFFIEKDLNKALELYEILDSEIIGNETYNGIKNNLFSGIMDVDKILEANRELQKYSQSVKLQMDEIILLKYSMQFVEAHEKALKLLDNGNLSEKDRIMLLELLSECALFNGDFDKSVEYITKAKDLGKELVFDPVHQLYMSRLLRCGNHEGVRYGVEFQQTHPNITDWIKPISITKSTDGEGEAFSGEFTDFIREHGKQFQAKIDFYNNNTISFYQFQRIANVDMLNALSYPECYGTKIVIGTGNNEEIQAKVEQIGTSVVIDAFTLLFLEVYQISDILDVFETVYITYSTIEKIETLYLHYDCKAIIKVFQRIKEDLRFEKCPNYANYSEEDSIYHSKSFLDALEFAKRKKCKFLCFDAITSLFFEGGKEHMIGIMPVIQKMKNTRDDDLAAKMIYNLIDKKVTFVNFSAGDIIYALKQTDEQAERKLSSFMKINTNCDVDSFCCVYLHTVRLLLLSGEEKLTLFLERLLQMADKVYNRARMEKWRYEQYGDDKHLQNHFLYSRFVIILIAGLIGMFFLDERISAQLYGRDYKFIPAEFIDKICEKCKDGKHFTEATVKELTHSI